MEPRYRQMLAEEGQREALDPCHGCGDRYLDRACCCIIPSSNLARFKLPYKNKSYSRHGNRRYSYTSDRFYSLL